MKISEDPALMERWDYERNHGKDPSKITTGNSKIKLYWRCLDHPHSTVSSPSYYSKTQRCAVCYGRQVWEGFNDFKTMNPDRSKYWDYTKNPDTPRELTSGSSKKRWFVCDSGHSFEIGLNSISSGRWCRYCSRNVVVPGETDILTVRPELSVIWDWDENPDPTTVSVRSGTMLSWVCRDYPHKWVSTPGNLLGCAVCSGHQVWPGFNDFKTHNPQRANYWDYTKNTGTPEEFTKGSGKEKYFTCENNHSFKLKLGTATDGVWCPYCSGRLPTSETSLLALYPEVANEWSPLNDITPNDVLPHSNSRRVWECPKGHEWEAYVYSRTYGGSGCRTCNPAGSKMQKSVSDFIRGLIPGEEVMDDYVDAFSDRRHVDIYVPGRSIAFEFNGLYWHSDATGLRNSPVAAKVQDCTDSGVDLYVIWEDDWRDRQEIVKRWLKNLLRVSDQEKINARDCEIKGTTVEDSRVFLLKNHIQGYASGSTRVGMYHDGDLVAIAVLSSWKNGSLLKLERYATSANVRGGFSKLMKWVDRNIEYETMETFADLTYSKGKLYENTGWIAEKTLSPDYSYIFKGERVHKFNFRLKRFREDGNLLYETGKTERELAAMNNLYRVYDAGKIKYTRKNPTI